LDLFLGKRNREERTPPSGPALALAEKPCDLGHDIIPNIGDGTLVQGQKNRAHYDDHQHHNQPPGHLIAGFACQHVSGALKSVCNPIPHGIFPPFLHTLSCDFAVLHVLPPDFYLKRVFIPISH
jgi:hypothetical protein